MTAATLAVLLAAIAILISCSALFSGVETALFLLKLHQLRRLEANHPGLTKFIQLFQENPRPVLNVMLLADGLVKVVTVGLCTLCVLGIVCVDVRVRTVCVQSCSYTVCTAHIRMQMT